MRYFFLLFIFPLSLFGQVPDTIYADNSTFQVLEYYTNGQLKSNISYYIDTPSMVYPDGWTYRKGPERHWNTYGVLVATGQNDYDFKLGPWLEYYDNGGLYARYNYRYGSADSAYAVYYPNGTIYERGNYDMGIRIGAWQQFFSNGSIKVSGFYVKQPTRADTANCSTMLLRPTNYNGPISGIYDKPGALRSVSHGEWLFYDETDLLTIQVTYRYGEIVEE